jgi:hypothetical protein
VRWCSAGGGKVPLSPSGNNQIVAPIGGGILSNVNSTIAGAGSIGGGLTVVNSGTINANTVSTLQLNASTINAGRLEATASAGTLILAANISNTGTGTILASGSGAHIVLNGAVISGGKLQTQAGGEIDVINGLLSDATIASGSIVDINGTLALSGRIANSGLISALGSPFATLAISGAVLLSGGGNVSLSPSGNNQIVAAPGGGILSNVNNTIAGAGFIGGGLTVVNSGTINGQHRFDASAQCKHDQCRQARGNGERRRAHTSRQHQQYRHWHYFSLGQWRARRFQQRDDPLRQAADLRPAR